MVAVVATTGIEVISTLIVMMILMQILKTMSRVTSETKTFFKMLKTSTFAMFRCCMYLHLLVVLVLVLQRCMFPIHVCWFGFDGI